MRAGPKYEHVDDGQAGSPLTLPGPRRLRPWYADGFGLGRVLLDVIGASAALLFVIFGFLVYQADGKPSAARESQRLLSVAQWGPTIFPVLFAAVVGRAMRSLATWRIQRGATVKFVEQLMGSYSISGAVFTQLFLHAFDLVGLAIVLIWVLSPLGSQASLRVISPDTVYLTNNTALTAIDTFSRYPDAGVDSIDWSYIPLRAIFSAGLMSVKLLQTRNQDIWGNIRIPYLGHDAVMSDDWTVFANTSNVTYSSLVGVPIFTIPQEGNTTFTMSTSYLDPSCSVFDLRPALDNATNDGFTNYSSPDAPRPPGRTDCSWDTASGYLVSVAGSRPCQTLVFNSTTGRDARVLVLESLMDYVPQYISHMECQLFTTRTGVFELRLAQLLNTQFLSALSPNNTIGFFEPADQYSNWRMVNVTAQTTTSRSVVRCNHAWLAALIIASAACFVAAVAGAAARLATLVPDVLGTLSLAMLDNRCGDIAVGGSTLDGATKAALLKNVRVRLGDVRPQEEVGLIALAGPLGSETSTKVAMMEDATHRNIMLF
ncbi:hypothetical protein T310_0976 [Rasamsonia emersonii CBS 393.64]|uniref:Uncharacterized protein n=1 Tax=Rasamsonia emersonii (strain ATCC 16479 / CBS 393.64 / IMI 116815) TaxID=1408163 RepID=A0A0F4Z3R5_RASE3|nr:hypothetical protein T310_0976 [Rasamsonia emersonii CBS 393.64]KKA24995.1 hypothetical protein T310_0976 [Rasamsonia emersonii CBS 393.64]